MISVKELIDQLKRCEMTDRVRVGGREINAVLSVKGIVEVGPMGTPDHFGEDEYVDLRCE